MTNTPPDLGEELRGLAISIVGPAPNHHYDGCQCPDCMAHEAEIDGARKALLTSRNGGVPDGWISELDQAVSQFAVDSRASDNDDRWKQGASFACSFVREYLQSLLSAIPNPPASEQPSRADTDRAIQIGRELDAEDGGYPLPEQFAENAKCSEQATIPAPDVSHLRQKAGD